MDIEVEFGAARAHDDSVLARQNPNTRMDPSNELNECCEECCTMAHVDAKARFDRAREDLVRPAENRNAPADSSQADQYHQEEPMSMSDAVGLENQVDGQSNKLNECPPPYSLN